MEESVRTQQFIHDKGFKFGDPDRYSKIKVGSRSLEDVIVDLSQITQAVKHANYCAASKRQVLKAIAEQDLAEQRRLSNLFYDISGIYQKVCNTFAFLYRYDWYAVPEIYDNAASDTKVLKEFYKVLNFLDESYVRKLCGDIALQVIKQGAYYGYLTDAKDSIVLQNLPIDYCRTKYSKGNIPVVEFNMRYFDTFRDLNYRLKVLKIFPEEFHKGYVLYKQGKLGPEYTGDASGSWYVLDPDRTIKFNINHSDAPMFINAIPAILDLDSAQEIDRRKQLQSMSRILVQQLPTDKNGDLIFDIDEARDIHQTAVEMLDGTIGTDILTTFSQIKDINLSDNGTASATDALERVERAVYNALGVSQNLFNADGNLSMEKSVLNDESSLRDLLFQFNQFLNRIVKQRFTSSKKYNFKVYMLETTQYNYRELSKMYKEQTQLGYSKMLPQIALGHSQSFILNTAFFENETLRLSEIMIPPLMSSTMSSQDVLGRLDAADSNKAGRPELEEGQKSDKTLQNEQSLS